METCSIDEIPLLPTSGVALYLMAISQLEPIPNEPIEQVPKSAIVKTGLSVKIFKFEALIVPAFLRVR